jgi:hypothetical protein
MTGTTPVFVASRRGAPSLGLPTPPGGRWGHCQTEVVEGARRVGRGTPGLVGPSAFPRFRLAEPPKHHGYGRPRISDANLELALFSAWARDVCGLTQGDLARALFGTPGEDMTGGGEIKRVQRAERAGRDVYRNRGILPWAAYSAGRLPTRWWTEEPFERAVNRWQLESSFYPLDELHDPDPVGTLRRDRAFLESLPGYTTARAEEFARTHKPKLRALKVRAAQLAGLPPEYDEGDLLRWRDLEPWSFSVSE